MSASPNFYHFDRFIGGVEVSVNEENVGGIFNLVFNKKIKTLLSFVIRVPAK
jgi:hypothetical protein